MSVTHLSDSGHHVWRAARRRMAEHAALSGETTPSLATLSTTTGNAAPPTAASSAAPVALATVPAMTGATAYMPLSPGTRMHDSAELNAAFGSTGNVRNSGAKGDGVTDDTTAIQGVANGGGILYFQAGIYQVSRPITVPSGTAIRGDAATLRAGTGFPINSPLIVNQNVAATVLTDHDISVFGMVFDYATFGTGGSHAIEMDFVTNVTVLNCTFQCRGAGNATAMPGSYNTSVEGCSAYGFTNCAYDWWWGPKNARLINSYAETAASSQMINFNPEQTTGSGGGFVASGLSVTGCQFRATGSSAVPMQVEPLNSGTTVSDVTIQNNVFVNLFLSMRGAVSNAIVAGNVFDGCLGGNEVIRSYAANGGTPGGITVVNNVVNNAATVGGSVAVIRIETAPAIVMGNSVINATGGAYAYSTGTSTAIFLGNLGSPHTTANAIGGPGPPVWTA